MDVVAAVMLTITLTIDADVTYHDVQPLWLGQNVEWVWQGQGLFRPDGSGAKPGVVDLIKPLKPALIRYPGGSLANTFRWAQSVGPPAQRAPITNFFEKTPERPLLGFDDHMRFCAAVGAAGAMVTVNCTQWPDLPQDSGSAQEAAAWVAYANAKVGAKPVALGKDYRGIDWRDSQHWATLRAANGHPAPYDVLHWEIGNEVYDKNQGAAMTPEDYAQRVIDFSHAMKAVDPRVCVGAIHWPRGKWNAVPKAVRAADAADFLIIHEYPSAGRHLFNYTAGLHDLRRVALEFDAAPGEATLAIKAWGRPYRGEAPGMQITLNGTTMQPVEVVSTDRKAPQVVTVPVQLAAHNRLAILLANDAPDEGKPYRDLYLEAVTVQPKGGEAFGLDLETPEALMVRCASTAERYCPPAPKPRDANALPYHRTEYAAMPWQTANNLAGAVLSARMAQAALLDANCEGANYWCIKSANFLAIESGPDGFRHAPGGLVFRTLAPLAGGKVVDVRHEGDFFRGSWIYVPRRITWVQAVATRQPGRLAVNMVAYHPTQTARVALNLKHVALASDRARLLIVTGPAPDAVNAKGKPPVITLHESTIPAAASTTVTLPPCSVATVIFETK